MRVSDRAIGYFTLLALICIIGLVTLGMWNAHHEETYSIVAEFDELGSLQPEDEVTVRGYTVGHVGKISWLGTKAKVEINFDAPLVLREGTQINDVNYALMGQRRLEIIPSRTGNILPKDYVFQGHFEPGIAEALRLIENVNEQLVVVRDVVHLIAEGDSNQPSFPEIFENTMQTIEGLLENVDSKISSVTPQLQKVFKEVEVATNTAKDMADQVDSTVKVVNNTVNEKVNQAENVIKTISEGADKANKIIAQIENDPAADKLLNSTETVDKVNTLINKLNELVKAIDTRGVKVFDENGKPVKLITWKNMNIIGKTARQKAKERAEKGESLD